MNRRLCERIKRQMPHANAWQKVLWSWVLQQSDSMENMADNIGLSRHTLTSLTYPVQIVPKLEHRIALEESLGIPVDAWGRRKMPFKGRRHQKVKHHLIGRTAGPSKVVSEHGTTRRYWTVVFQCPCGATFEMGRPWAIRSVFENRHTVCHACRPKSAYKDSVGLRAGNVVVIAQERDIATCQCDCGAIFTRAAKYVRVARNQGKKSACKDCRKKREVTPWRHYQRAAE